MRSVLLFFRIGRRRFSLRNEGSCRRSSLRCAAVGDRSSLRWLSSRIITKVLAATRPSSYCPVLGMLLSRRSEDEHSVGRGRHRSPCWAQGPAAPEMNEINRDADAFDQLSQHDRCRWPRRVLGPPWDHTLCVMVNDLRVCARHARSQIGYALAMTCGNALPLFTGGQVVAGSNPFSPTIKKLPLSAYQRQTAGERASCRCRDGTFGRGGCRAPRSRIAS